MHKEKMEQPGANYKNMKKKSVCHITTVHSRYDTRIFHKECVSLSNAGYRVSLIVNDDKQDEQMCGINIYSTHYINKNRLERMVKATKRVYKLALELDADIYHLHDPELLRLVSKLKRKGYKVIFDSHENVSDSILDSEWLPKYCRKLIAFIYKHYEAMILKKVNAIITVTPRMTGYFNKINTYVAEITNYPILERSEEKNEYRNRENAICFAGGIFADSGGHIRTRCHRCGRSMHHLV